MGDLVAVFRIMPEGAEVDLDDLQSRVKAATPEGAELQGHELKPVAFGLKALDVTIVLNDADDSVTTDQVEEAYAALEGVGSVKVTDIGRF